MRTISASALMVAQLILLAAADHAASGGVATLATILCLPISILLGLVVSRELSQRDVANAGAYGLFACLVPVIGFLVYVVVRRKHAVAATL